MDIRYEFGHKPIGSGDYDLFSQILYSSHRENVGQFQKAAWRIRDGIGFSQSIDDFLDQHRNDECVNIYGKAAIVEAVLEAERASRLFFDKFQGTETFDLEKLTDTWFVKFMYMLGRGIARENVNEIFDKVSFIVFNYDRCIEHFLLNAVQRAYALKVEDAQQIMRNLHIIHPYGAVGELDKVQFGAGQVNCLKLSEGIKTYTEQAAVAEVTNSIAAEVTRATCIVFLGFAFHSQNLRLLRPAEKMRTRPVFGTAHGLSDSDLNIVSQNFADFFNQTLDSRQRTSLIKLENKLKCAELFDYYAKSLSGGD